MSEPWFRMHANILDKPVVWRLAEATGIHPVRAAGHLAAFWGKVSQHGSQGRVGDLPDTQLEAWAGWDGKKGAFARWLREKHLTDGVVNEYDEYSGALEQHREKTRERVKKWRTEREAKRERNASGNNDVTRTVTVTDALRNDVTIRNDTKLTTGGAARGRKPPQSSEPAGDPDALPARHNPWVAEAGDDWRDIRGGYPNYGKLAKQLANIVRSEGWETVRPKWQRFLASAEVRYGAAYFAEHAGQYTAPASRLIGVDGDEYGALAAIGVRL